MFSQSIICFIETYGKCTAQDLQKIMPRDFPDTRILGTISVFYISFEFAHHEVQNNPKCSPKTQQESLPDVMT